MAPTALAFDRTTRRGRAPRGATCAGTPPGRRAWSTTRGSRAIARRSTRTGRRSRASPRRNSRRGPPPSGSRSSSTPTMRTRSRSCSTRYPDLTSIKDLGGCLREPVEAARSSSSSARRERSTTWSTDDARRRRRGRAARALRAQVRVDRLSGASPGGVSGRARSMRSSRTRTRRFLSDRTRNRFDAARGRLEVSKIFDWYGDDFARAAGSVAKFLGALRGGARRRRARCGAHRRGDGADRLPRLRLASQRREKDTVMRQEPTFHATDGLAEVRRYYGEVLRATRDLKTSACCAGDAVPERLRALVADVHPEIRERFYGCGLPLPPALDGCTVLDLGCGTGRDCYVLSRLVGERRARDRRRHDARAARGRAPASRLARRAVRLHAFQRRASRGLHRGSPCARRRRRERRRRRSRTASSTSRPTSRASSARSSGC